MEILREIFRIVTSKMDTKMLFPELEVTEQQDAEETITGQFLQILLSDEIKTEEEACLVLYGDSTKSQRYRTLKSRIHERLLHSLLFLQVKQPEHSEYLSYYYKCTRNVLCAQTLMRFASRKAGFTIASKTLTIAEKYNFTDICLNLSVMLRDSVAFWQKSNQFYMYNERVTRYVATLEAEYHSDFLLDKYMLEGLKSGSTRTQMRLQAKSCLKEIKKLQSKFGSHSLNLNTYRARFMDAIQENDFEEILAISEDAITYLNDNPHLKQPARLGEFMIRKMTMLFNLRRHDEALTISESAVNSFAVGGNNWYVALDLATVCAIYVGDFSKAINYYKNATSHRRFLLLDESRKEGWAVYEAYLVIAKQLKMHPDLLDFSPSKRFRITTYLNSIPEEVKVKKYSNVTVLLSHVYLLIIDRDFDGAEKRIDYLRVYVFRYLKEKSYLRVRIFIKMLMNLSKSSFNPIVAEENNIALKKELYSTLKLPVAYGTSVELIPFERDNENILQFLRKQAS